MGKRKGIYAIYSSFAVGAAADRRVADMALQRRLGLLPERRLRPDFPYCVARCSSAVTVNFWVARWFMASWPGKFGRVRSHLILLLEALQ